MSFVTLEQYAPFYSDVLKCTTVPGVWVARLLRMVGAAPPTARVSVLADRANITTATAKVSVSIGVNGDGAFFHASSSPLGGASMEDAQQWAIQNVLECIVFDGVPSLPESIGAGHLGAALHNSRDLSAARVEILMRATEVWQTLNCRAIPKRPAPYAQVLRPTFEDAWTIVQEDTALSKYANGGENLVILSEGIQSALNRTSPPSNAPMPFDTFAISLAVPAYGARVLIVADGEAHMRVEVGWVREPRLDALAQNVGAYMSAVPTPQHSTLKDRVSLIDEAMRKKGGKRARLLKKAQGMAIVTTVVLGTDPKPTGVQLVSTDGPSHRRHWVRGFWRRQRVGVRAVGKTRLTWIRPHERGDVDRGVVVGRDYTTGSA